MQLVYEQAARCQGARLVSAMRRSAAGPCHRGRRVLGSFRGNVGYSTYVGCRTFRLTWFACALLCAAVWARPVLAHPHVWITVEAQVVYENGFFTGIAQTWIFDEFYTSYAVQGLDANGDGAYDQGELAELTSKYRYALGDDAYFTLAELRGEKTPFGSPTDFHLDVKDGILSQSFILPFSSPIPREVPELRFAVFDPSYFIAFELDKVGFLSRGTSVPSTCSIRIMAESDVGPLTLPPRGTVANDFSPNLMEPFGTVSVACGAP